MIARTLKAWRENGSVRLLATWKEQSLTVAAGSQEEPPGPPKKPLVVRQSEAPLRKRRAVAMHVTVSADVPKLDRIADYGK